MRVLVLVVTLLGLLVAPAAAEPRHSLARSYVALGDSYAAGPGIPNQVGQPAGCARSDRNYPALIAKWLRIPQFTDVSCSGARTVDMTKPQKVSGGTNPPQLNALRADTDLVTVMIGGNDMGFGEILQKCGQLAAHDQQGNPCERYYTSGGTDRIAARISGVGSKVSAVLGEIRKRAPRAHVVVVGYLRILPPNGTCFPQVPFAAGDVPYFDRTSRLLNAELGAQATKHKASYVNPYPYSHGHDACQPADRKWVEGLFPSAPAAQMHPNAKGMQAVAMLSVPSVLFGRFQR
ncbi:SGNH/GDSL hydrolase family protein [Kibdelosporangium phytohabitans]|uniref:GDSL family lipase n=1 Tax=Kibdelosporangium phytohabitans TaxID=860235 RepID=A0A0N9IB08_9PSEU|nr:SGNH/GDSL hydrolase family protein [Kibdelosporangium phytohabitans]ALG13526.1 GDSL family lipase [Kibdelosporangium phytohabitans]MBE1465383.1 lysophospholipase L1-like esterase [Kibdelosporangium phytohabitans]